MAERDDSAPITLADIQPGVPEPSSDPDPLVVREEDELIRRKQKAEIEGMEAEIKARSTYAGRIFWLAAGWLVGVAVILGLQGFRWWSWQPLPDNVLIALVTGSTVGVLGILASVIAYIFRVPK